jgi:hypothetical protein
VSVRGFEQIYHQRGRLTLTHNVVQCELHVFNAFARQCSLGKFPLVVLQLMSDGPESAHVENAYRQSIHDELTVFDGLLDCQFKDVHIEFLPQPIVSRISEVSPMRTVERLILQPVVSKASEHLRRVPPKVHQNDIVAAREIEAYLAVVDGNAPVLPALKEMRMTRTFEEDLMVSNASCRLSFRMEPSSTVSARGARLTSHICDSCSLQERLDKIEKAGELGEYDGLFFALTSSVNVT